MPDGVTRKRNALPYKCRFIRVALTAADPFYRRHPDASVCYTAGMFDAYLVEENTIVSTKGDGSVLDIGAAQNRTFLLVLKITDVVEQQSLDVSVFGSADAETWQAKPLLSFPQLFYAGERPLLLDLAAHPDVKFLRAHWDVNRWGRGPESPMFAFGLRVREVAPELLK